MSSVILTWRVNSQSRTGIRFVYDSIGQALARHSLARSWYSSVLQQLQLLRLSEQVVCLVRLSNHKASLKLNTQTTFATIVSVESLVARFVWSRMNGVTIHLTSSLALSLIISLAIAAKKWSAAFVGWLNGTRF
jgi:hypothetical protein